MLPEPSEPVDFDRQEGSARWHICDERNFPASMDEARALADRFYEKYPYMADLAREAEKD